MANAPFRQLLNNGKAAFGLIRGSSLGRSGVSSVKLAPSQLLSHLRDQEPPRVDLAALLGAQGSSYLPRVGGSVPVFHIQTARSYSRGRRAEISDEEGEDEEYEDMEEWSEDDEVVDDDELVDMDELGIDDDDDE